MSVGRPKMKRDAVVKAVFLLRKKTAFTPASLFIFGRPTDVMALAALRTQSEKWNWNWLVFCHSFSV